MDDIWSTIAEGLRVILVPARTVMEWGGLHPSDIQVWALMVSIFIVVLVGPTSYGDWVLRSRSRRVVGTVIAIDDRDETVTPRISFTDERGQLVEFDSPLAVNARTNTVGGTVDVIYDPLNPKRAREANRVLYRYSSTVLWYGIAVALAVYAIAGGLAG